MESEIIPGLIGITPGGRRPKRKSRNQQERVPIINPPSVSKRVSVQYRPLRTLFRPFPENNFNYPNAQYLHIRRPPSTNSQEFRCPPSMSSQEFRRSPSTGSQEFRRPPSISSQEFRHPPSISSQEFRHPPSTNSQEFRRSPSTGSQEFQVPVFQEKIVSVQQKVACTIL